MSEVFIGRKGRFVKLEETIDGFGGILYYIYLFISFHSMHLYILIYYIILALLEG